MDEETTKRRRDRLALVRGVFYCAVSLLFGIQATLLGPAATILAHQIKGTEADLAPVMGIGGIMCIVGGMPSGIIVDAFPGHVVLSVSMIVQAVGYAVMPYCSSVLLLTVVYAIIALTFNTINTGLNSLTPWAFSFSSPRSAFWLNMVSAMFGIGGLVAPQLVTLCEIVLQADSLCFLIIAGASAFGAAVSLVLVSPPNPAAAMIQAAVLAPASPLLLDPAHVVVVPPPVTKGGGGGGPAHPGPLCGPDKWRRATGLLIPVAGLVFLNVSIELTLGNWIYTYAVRYSLMTKPAAEMLTSLYWFAFTAGRVVAAVLASMLKPSTVLLMSTPFAIVGGIMPLIPAFQVAFCPWAIHVCVCFIGVGASAGYANTLSLMADYLALDGIVNGWIGTIAGIAWTVFPSLVPVLVKHSLFGVQWQWLMYVMLVMAVLQFLLIFWIMAAGKVVRAQQIARLSAFAVDPGSRGPDERGPDDVSHPASPARRPHVTYLGWRGSDDVAEGGTGGVSDGGGEGTLTRPLLLHDAGERVA